MEKRLILALSLSLFILLIWSLWSSQFYPIANKSVTEEISKKIETPFVSPSTVISSSNQNDLNFLKVSQQKVDFKFNEAKASIVEVIFKDYQDYAFSLSQGFEVTDPNWQFKKIAQTDNSVTFAFVDKDKKIIKHFIFSNYNYHIGLEIEFYNLSTKPLKLDSSFILGQIQLNQNQEKSRFQDIIASAQEKTLHCAPNKNIVVENLKFLSIRDRYFCAIIEPVEEGYAGFIKKADAQKSIIGLLPSELEIEAGKSIKRSFEIYLGPQELKIVSAKHANWSGVLYFGVFDVIAHTLLQILSFLNSVFHNWGFTIIAISFFIYFLLFPFNLKQMRSMKQMQTIQPAVEELRKTHKNNPQKLNKEIMELYKNNKVNPFGGCLPMILQIPIFFALYQVLMRSVFLKGAKFLWIKDLSEPDRLFHFPASLPVLGNDFNILPILMALIMFLQQKISAPMQMGEQAQQQKLMTIIFPFMFGFIFYHMPAGLVIYWFVNSLLTLVFQFRLKNIKCLLDSND